SVLEIASEFARFWPDREHAVGVKIIEPAARFRIVRLGIPRAPVHQIELRIVRPRAPRGAAALRPGIGALGPGLRTRLAGSRNRVPPPQLLPGIGIPAVQEPARGGFAARD